MATAGATPSILIAEDDVMLRHCLCDLLRREGMDVRESPDGDGVLSLLRQGPVDILLLDHSFPNGKSGLTVLSEVADLYPGLRTILISGSSDADLVMNAMKIGAADFLRKPFEPAQLIRTIRDTFQYIQSDRKLPYGQEQASPEPAYQSIISESPQMVEILKIAGRVAGSLIPVFITGDTGTGKEMVAQCIHKASARKGPLVAIDCGSIPLSLLEGELFGYERGAFTGAGTAKPGRFEAADGGTILLDEIGNIPLEMQPKLLRVLDSSTSQRLGSSQIRSWDVRVISATNADIPARMKEGSFREDLFYRLCGVQIGIPPLRERREDVLPLARHFASRSAGNGKAKVLAPETASILQAYGWPGNVRELSHAISHAVALSKGSSIQPRHLPGNITSSFIPAACPQSSCQRASGLKGLVPLREMNAQYAAEALNACGGNKSRASKALGINRRTLRSLLGQGSAAIHSA